MLGKKRFGFVFAALPAIQCIYDAITVLYDMVDIAWSMFEGELLLIAALFLSLLHLLFALWSLLEVTEASLAC